MADQSRIEVAKAKIIEAIKDLSRSYRQEILDAVNQQLPEVEASKTETSKTGEMTQPETANPGNSLLMALFFLIPVSIFVISILLSKCLYPAQIPEILSTKDLLTFLGFVVALASYIASVAREIVKALPNIKEPQKKTKSKRNIYLLGITDASLILLGLFTVIRLLSKMYALQPLHNIKHGMLGTFSSDSFLITSLSLILLGLAVRHLFVWLEEAPWRL